jgi:hypothetical protein
MKKYKVKVHTTSPDLLPTCVMDEFMLEETLMLEDTNFLRLDDDTEEKFFLLNVSQIVGIEWMETQE